MENKKDSSIIESFIADELELVLNKPTVHILREAKFIYNKAFTSALKEGFSTKKKLEEQLKQGDINVIDLHVNRRSEILKLYVDTNAALLGVTDPDTIEYYAGILSFYRDSLVREDTEMTNLFATTADQFAEDARIDYLTYSLVRNADKTPLWKTEEDFSQDLRINLVETCKYHVICWEYKLDPDWQKELPESKAMDKAKELRLLNKEILDKNEIEGKLSTEVEPSTLEIDKLEIEKVKVVKKEKKTKKNLKKIKLQTSTT